MNKVCIYIYSYLSEEVVEWGDVEEWDRQVLSVEANARAGTPSKQCHHADLGKCPKCSPHKRAALRQWKEKNKRKSVAIVKKKLNKKFAAVVTEAKRCGVETPSLRLRWAEIARNTAWVAEISQFSRQWQMCEQHQRFQYETCLRCKGTMKLF